MITGMNINRTPHNVYNSIVGSRFSMYIYCLSHLFSNSNADRIYACVAVSTRSGVLYHGTMFGRIIGDSRALLLEGMLCVIVIMRYN